MFLLNLLNVPTRQVQHRTGSIIPTVLQHKRLQTQPRAFNWIMPRLTDMQREPTPPLPPTSKLLCYHLSASFSHPLHQEIVHYYNTQRGIGSWVGHLGERWQYECIMGLFRSTVFSPGQNIKWKEE